MSSDYQNKNFVGEDGFIHQIYLGEQTAQTVQEDIKRLAKLIETVHKQGKPAHLLLDLGKFTHQDSGARKEATNALNNLKYEKIALFGTKNFIKYVANFVVLATRKSSTVKFFDSEDEAMRWLKS